MNQNQTLREGELLQKIKLGNNSSIISDENEEALDDIQNFIQQSDISEEETEFDGINNLPKLRIFDPDCQVEQEIITRASIQK